VARHERLHGVFDNAGLEIFKKAEALSLWLLL
jgi:hypothetical protein